MVAKSNRSLAFRASSTENRNRKNKRPGGTIVASLVAKLESGNPDQQRAAARRLRLVAEINSNNDTSAIAKAGAIPLLAELLKSPDPRTQENAIRALHELSQNETNKVIFGDPLVITLIVRMLKYDGSAMKNREYATGILSNLSVVDTNKLLIGAAGAIPPLVGFLSHGTPIGKKYAAKAIFYLSKIKLNTVIALRAGIVPQLMRLLKDSLNSGGIVNEGQLALFAMFAGNQEGKVAMGETEPIPFLVEVIRRGSPGNQENAILAMLSLCKDGNAQYLEIARKLGAEEVLKKLSDSGSDLVKRVAGILLGLVRGFQDGRVLELLQQMEDAMVIA